MARDNATSLDVARHAGVSQSAVSRVFTPGASVSMKMADKVKRSADALGYRPNVLARSLITGQSRIIGLVVAYLDNQFYPEALERLSMSLQEQGYNVLVFMASKTAGNIDQVLEEILDYQVDGVIMASVAMSSSLAKRCDEAGIPVVLFNRRQSDLGFSSVTSDNMSGGQKLARFLIAGGHQRIGYIAGWDGASTQHDREAGFVMGLQDAGQSLFARGCGNFMLEEARIAARDMFSPSVIPDAVFVANDHMAFAVMDVLRFELGLSVPDDVSVVGYDDVQLASWTSYDLTTVRQPVNKMVSETIAILMARIEQGHSQLRNVELDGSLIVRGSAKIQEGWEDAGV